MNIVLLKNRTEEPSMTLQQKQILKYAHHHDLNIDVTEIENSDRVLELEDRKEFKGFLRSLDEGDHLFVYNLSTFSDSVEELVKVFECLLKRSISVHIAEEHILIESETKPLILLEILCKQREISKQSEKEKAQGRPKGRMSKSKFDIHRPYIIEHLENRVCVSEIAKKLDVSRTSLKDYINSRGLKELVKAKMILLKSPPKKNISSKSLPPKKCSLVSDETLPQ